MGSIFQRSERWALSREKRRDVENKNENVPKMMSLSFDDEDMRRPRNIDRWFRKIFVASMTLFFCVFSWMTFLKKKMSSKEKRGLHHEIRETAAKYSFRIIYTSEMQDNMENIVALLLKDS